MWCIGVDAHKKRCFLTAKDEQGNLVHRRKFDHTPEGWAAAFADAPKGSKVAIECVGWYQPIFDLLEGMGLVPVLAHARNVALIAKSRKKTDRYDADVLCDLLRTGFLPMSHVPTKEARELRELTRYLDDVVKDTIRVKGRIQRLLERAWCITPEVNDLFGKEGRGFLASANVSSSQRVVLDASLRQLDTLETVREDLERKIAKAVEHDEQVDLLLGLDGVSAMGAAVLRAEIDNVDRFPNRKAVRSNFGMAVSVRDSADTEKRGRITKQGSGQVRKVLVHGALHFADNNENAGKKYDRLLEHRGAGCARVAAGGDLLDTAYQVLKTRAPYRHVKPHLLARKRRELARMAAAAT